MRLWNFIIFISIVSVIYGSINYYIFMRGLQAIPKDSQLKTYYIIIFLFLALSFWAGRILENFILSTFTDVLVWIGVFWLALMLYFILFIVGLDLLRLANHFFGIFPSSITENYEKTKLITGIAVVAVSAVIVFTGYINFITPRVHTMELTLPKKNSKLDTLNIVVASDTHLGTTVRNSRLEDFVQKANALNPDIILMPGDIIDEDLAPVIKLDMGEGLKKLKAKYGVYAVTGNHEYIGGVDGAVKYLEEHNIKMVRDTAVLVDSSFYIVGREDKDITRFSGRTRKSLDEIMLSVDKNYPTILLDHQPRDLYIAEENGIDLQLSGHTHHGQLWPLNYVTEMVYEVSWGYKKRSNTHYYVSSGFAGWGPPVRTGSRTELVNIIVKFE